MNPQPTIFISSIISEFFDLRGALKYFLGKSGFRVLMSEEPDFGADCGLDSLDNCKNRIEESDYYLLLIGNQPGSTFQLDGKDSSVTFEEFKHYITLIKTGKPLNLIAFVRKQTWDSYKKKDTNLIHPLQIELIDELINNSLLDDMKIGRWRYVFERFADIITVLETNQNGLFLEATRKSSLYKKYIEREIYDILKTFLQKSTSDGIVKCVTQIIELPELENLDLFNPTKIDPKIAIRIKAFLTIIKSRDTLLRKVNRVFVYIAQGEFSRFDPINEKYILPEYIKLTMQSLEILEKVFDNSNNFTVIEEIRNRNSEVFYMNKLEYDLVKDCYNDLKIVIIKLVNLTNYFSKNWYDLEPRPESFYSFGRISGYNVSTEDVIDFADKFNNQ